MPTYFYRDPRNNTVIQITQSVNDVHEYYDNDVKFERIFTVPHAAVDTKIDPMSQRDFVEKTGKKTGTIDDLWSQSRELSEQRERIFGEDKIKKKARNHAKKVRRGGMLPEEFKENQDSVVWV